MSQAEMNYCDVCFEEYPGELEQHKKKCVVRFLFQCVMCNWNYVRKDALLIHLDMHEISDGNKESYCQEMKVEHKLYQCVLCNDKRAYSESSYKNHVQNVHDGICFCSHCGQNFTTEELRLDHVSFHCLARVRTVKSIIPTCSADENISNIIPIKSELITSDSTDYVVQQEEQNYKSNVRVKIITSPVDSRLNEVGNSNAANVSDKNITEQKAELQPIDNAEENNVLLPGILFACDICGITFSSNHATYYHKKTKHGQMHRCPHCRRIFRKEEYESHLPICEKNRISCKLCDSTFELRRNLTRHMKRIHHVRKKPKKEKQPSQDVTFSCDICGSQFPSYHHVQYHKRKDHGRNYKCPHCRSLFQLEEYSAHLSACEQKERISCVLCQSKYRSSIYLARHMKRVHQIPGKKNSFVATDDASSSRETSDSFQNVNTVGSMDEKNITESSENSPSRPAKEKCPQCDGVYSRGKSLLNHIRNIHRPSDCTICGITIYGMEKARYHKVMKHTKPAFECANCSKKFYWKKDFKFHTSICDPVEHNFHTQKKNEEHSQSEEIDLKMDIKVEETTLVPQDECGNSPVDPSTDSYCDTSKNLAPDYANSVRFKIKEELPDESYEHTSEFSGQS